MICFSWNTMNQFYIFRAIFLTSDVRSTMNVMSTISTDGKHRLLRILINQTPWASMIKLVPKWKFNFGHRNVSVVTTNLILGQASHFFGIKKSVSWTFFIDWGISNFETLLEQIATKRMGKSRKRKKKKSLSKDILENRYVKKYNSRFIYTLHPLFGIV